MNMSYLKNNKIFGLASLGLMLFAVFAVAISEIHSFDVFWQLQSGRYIWETKSMIYQDTFTLVADTPRHEHTWLHSVILYALYSLSGYGAISIWKGVMIAGTATTLVVTARRRSSSWPAIALVLPVYLLTSGGWLERPQLWTFFFTAVIIFALEEYLRHPSWKLLWLLPFVVFWGNAHAGSMLSLALIVAYLVGETGQLLIERRFSWRMPGQLFALLFAALLAGLANPYPAMWFNTLLGSYKLGASVDNSGKVTGTVTAVFNMDWTPTTFQNEPLFYYAVAVAGLILILGWRRLKLSDVCLLAGLALMGFKLVRHIPFFYIGAVAILPAYLDQIVHPIRQRFSEKLRVSSFVFFSVVALGLFWYLWQPVYKVYGSFNTGLREWHYPIQATKFVEEQRLAKNIYNTYDWGGYMAFKLFPEYLMFWDGRQTSSDMFQTGWNVMAGKPNWEEILNKFDVKTIVSRASTIDTGQKYPLLDRLKAHPDWSLVFNSESSLVFVKRGSVSTDWLRKNALSKERMDDTILSEAHLMVKFNANRYMAWWSMAEIYTKRKQYKNALFAVNQHLARTPRKNPAAVNLQRQLSAALNTKNN